MYYRSFSIICSTLLAIIILYSSVVAESNQKWQLVFKYDNSSIELVDAGLIPVMKKVVRTPGINSAPIKIEYRIEWLNNSGNAIFTTVAQLPLGIRSTLEKDEACQLVIPDEGNTLIRIDGPNASDLPSQLKLSRISISGKRVDQLPSVFNTEEIFLTIPPTTTRKIPEEGFVGMEKIHDTGGDDNRLVIVVMGDGYTQANLDAGQFISATSGLKTDMEQKSPWGEMINATNIYRVDLASNEQGADNEIFGIMKDTYLNTSFWISNIERLLYVTGDGYSLAVTLADGLVGTGVWDVLLVLANSTKYGGGGGALAVSSVHPSASEIILHELGHSYGHLADEYEYSKSNSGLKSGDSEPNVDYDFSGPGLKWNIWVEPGTPLPTPENYSYANVVGSFEGAKYQATGIYRPWYNCLMRSLGPALCPICQEAHLGEFLQRVTLSDSIGPDPLVTHEIDNVGQLFSVYPIPVSSLTYEWYLDGVQIDGANLPSIYLISSDLDAPSQTLEIKLTFATDLIRKDATTETYSWTVSQAPPSCCVGFTGDANYDGGIDPTVGDITSIINTLFGDGLLLDCIEEGDVDQSGGINPNTTDITVGDITTIIDYLFGSGLPLPACL